MSEHNHPPIPSMSGLTMEEGAQALSTYITQSLGWFLKGDEDVFQAMTNSLQDVLLGYWEPAEKMAISEVVAYLKNSPPGALTKADLDEIMGKLNGQLSKTVDEATQEILRTAVVNSYGASQEAVLGINPSFNVVDEKAMTWLTKDMVYWIDDHWDTALSDRMQKVGQVVVSSGVDRDKADQVQGVWSCGGLCQGRDQKAQGGGFH
jgi:hypothetical protein